jgi:hypothetical protein
MSIRLPSPDTCHPDRTWLLRRYLHLLSERPKDGRPRNCGIEFWVAQDRASSGPGWVSTPGPSATANAAAMQTWFHRLWMRICGASVTGSRSMMFNSTYWYDCARPHKAVYEPQKYDQQQSAPDGELHQLFRGKVVIALSACHKFLHPV